MCEILIHTLSLLFGGVLERVWAISSRYIAIMSRPTVQGLQRSSHSNNFHHSLIKLGKAASPSLIND